MGYRNIKLADPLVFKLASDNCMAEQFDYFEFKETLAEKLPRYMLPEKAFIVNDIPLNQNGKTDRNLVRNLVKEKLES